MIKKQKKMMHGFKLFWTFFYFHVSYILNMLCAIDIPLILLNTFCKIYSITEEILFSICIY